MRRKLSFSIIILVDVYKRQMVNWSFEMPFMPEISGLWMKNVIVMRVAIFLELISDI